MTDEVEGTQPNWEGVDGGAEHRTVGPHRAWCYGDVAWCYPTALCACCDQHTVPRRLRGLHVGEVLTTLRKAVEKRGHTNICAIQLHERNPHRRCTCWVQPMLDLLNGEGT